MSERLVCTKNNPRPIGSHERWIHPDAILQDNDDPYYDHYKCPNCGLNFSEEVPE